MEPSEDERDIGLAQKARQWIPALEMENRRLVRENDALRSEKFFWNCQTHGKSQNAWGCPECVRELREENVGLRALKTHCPDCGADYAATGIEAGFSI